ncbi:hypothetical protein JCM11491_001969 [Sporobolomyces phaffii]
MSDPQKILDRRDKQTQQALAAASRRVMTVLNEKTMKQCFPKYDDEFIKGLQTAFTDKFIEAIPPAWQDHTKEFDVTTKLEQFEAVCLAAEQRRQQGEPPTNHYEIAGDGSITIPSATVPMLKSATEELRQKRLALAAGNAERYKRIAEASTSTTTSETQIQKILSDFRKVLEDVKSVDEKEINDLQEKMLKIVGQDL